MWWFTRKASQQPQASGISPRQQAEEHLIALVPDMTAITEEQDATIKIWLPEIIARTVKWLADHEGVSQSAWLRERLMVYVYGRVAVQAMHIRHQRTQRDEVRFSRRAVDRTNGRWIYKVPQLGKNTVAFKLWVSEQMRADLQVLADHAQVALSAFAREAIVADMLGRASLPERPEIMGHPTAAAEAWERGEDVPVVEVLAEQFDDLGESERVWREFQPGQFEGKD